MSNLKSFATGANAVIVGATGGIGRAMVEQLSADPAVANVVALARRPERIEQPGIRTGRLDLEDEQTIEAAAAMAGEQGEIDLVIVTTGLLWQGNDICPEKSMRDLDAVALEKLFAVNAAGPAIVARHFLPKMRRRSKTVFAALSARVGSIGDNRLGGWYGYRASKAALNMLLRTLAIEHARRFPNSVIAGLHPGTVDTGLSRPFTSRTPEDRLFTTGQSAQYLLDVVDGLDPADSGGLFAWDGTRIEY